MGQNALLDALINSPVKNRNALMPFLDNGFQYRGDIGLPSPRQFADAISATGVPVVSDLASGALAVTDAINEKYGSAALNALGALPFVMAIDPAGKKRLISDLIQGQGSGTYKLGDVTAGQFDRLSREFGRTPAGNDVMMNNKALNHLLDGRIGADNFSPEEVGKFAEQAMMKRSAVDLDRAKGAQNPSLLNRGLMDSESGKRYDARMPLGLDGAGNINVLSVVPDGLRKRKGPSK
ncbi:hypothetical protein AB6Q56_14465 [Dechloromonas sp. ARDL1]|uniref:hypothetical protein n=1 Tax=Dechloromonas sp. ARDL1 TaxID=3322121 RepID=UPI003DA72E81